ncbi:MAG: hypothetical protein M3Q60_23365 [Actinomycetota bacterium]|nr:hypothetical protein [Actinomycetota bacterium]
MHKDQPTTGTNAAAAAAVGPVSPDARRTLLVRYALMALLGLLGAALYAAFLTAGPAHAQAEGGDQIIGFLQNVQDWMVQAVVPVAGIGFLSCAILKSVAGSNENMHHAAHMGAKGSLVALGAALMVGAFLGLIQGFVG